MDRSTPEPLLSVRQVAEWTNVNRATVRKWIDAGTLPATRLPHGEFRIQRRDVRRHILGETDVDSSGAA